MHKLVHVSRIFNRRKEIYLWQIIFLWHLLKVRLFQLLEKRSIISRIGKRLDGARSSLDAWYIPLGVICSRNATCQERRRVRVRGVQRRIVEGWDRKRHKRRESARSFFPSPDTMLRGIRAARNVQRTSSEQISSDKKREEKKFYRDFLKAFEHRCTTMHPPRLERRRGSEIISALQIT